MREQLDASQRPSGELALRSLIDKVALLDDAQVERHFLEVKSEIDLSSKEGLAKVAKFILAAANRMPDKAAAAFDGHALMLLGVGAGGVCGVDQVEAKDLSDGVLPYLSAAGPKWDFQRVMIGDLEVLVIDVSPPEWGHPIYACHREGPAGLLNGGIYVRADGASRPATGSEIDQLVARAARSLLPDLSVSELEISLLGSIRVPTCEPGVFDAYMRRQHELLDVDKAVQVLSDNDQSGGALPTAQLAALRFLDQHQLGGRDRRTPDEFLQQVAAWDNKVRDAWPNVLAEVAAGTFQPIEVKAHNRGRLFLRDVELIIEVTGPVRAFDWYEKPYLQEAIPAAPRRWGEGARSDLSALMPRLLPTTSITPRPRTVRFENLNTGVRIVTDISALRPETPYMTREEDFVLVADTVGCDVRATWSLTASDLHSIIRGELTVEVDAQPEDLSAEVWESLRS